MDILSHGLWAGAAAKGINLKKKSLPGSGGKKLGFWRTFLWVMFPDLFSFTIPFVWLFAMLVTGHVHFSDFHRPGTGAEPENRLILGNGDFREAQSFIIYLTSLLYDISHSAVIFALVFGITIIVRKRMKKGTVVPWEMCGWLLHILFDIPTHSYAFYPTPVFWPVASWKFHGYPWGHLWFIITDYSAIAITYLTMRYFEKNKK